MAIVRPLAERDLPEAQRIVRRAFGTFLDAPNLDNFWTDFDYIYGRFGCEHTMSFAIDDDSGTLAGSNFATRWGSIGFFGPISTRPDLWNRGLAQPLVKAVSDAFEEWDVSHAGLCTFPHSTKHVHLYAKFGFHPRFLTPLMKLPASRSDGSTMRWAHYSALPEGQRGDVETAARALTEQLYPGLDLGSEIRTNASRRHGDTLLLWDGDSRLAGFAVCHWGPASESPAGALFVKFGAARGGEGGEARFAALLDACAELAAEAGLAIVLAGVSTGREEAYRHMVRRGCRAEMHVVTMHRPNEPGYNRPGVFALDDWR